MMIKKEDLVDGDWYFGYRWHYKTVKSSKRTQTVGHGQWDGTDFLFYAKGPYMKEEPTVTPHYHDQMDNAFEPHHKSILGPKL